LGSRARGGLLSAALSVPAPKRRARALPGTMPCGARTFLPREPPESGPRAAARPIA